MYVQPRTDNTKYSVVDGTADAFGTTLELSAEGWGIRRTVKGIETFEVLEAFPAGRRAVQVAMEAGSATPSASMIAATGFTAVDFTSADNLDNAEVTASATDALTDEMEGPGDLV